MTAKDVTHYSKWEVLHVNPSLDCHSCHSTNMPLNDQQRDALEQLWAVTASTSDASRQRDERMLTENGFDVQVKYLHAVRSSLMR